MRGNHMRETATHSKIDEFAADFRAMIVDNEDKLLFDEGILITKDDYEIHIFAESEESANNEAIIQLIDNRRDLLDGPLESENFKEFVHATFELSDWLNKRGLRVGLSADGWWPRAQLYLFKWFPALFGV